jgi:ABC-2 type transport system permease protein
VNPRIRNVLSHEWRYLARSPSNLLYLTVIPLLLTGEALLVIALVHRFAGSAIAQSGALTPMLDRMAAQVQILSTASREEQVLAFLVYQFSFFSLLVPAMIANVFATLSLVEEKLSHILEPLLATPVRTWELLLGKALAGAVPAVVVSWICTGLFLLGGSALGWGTAIRAVLSPGWLLSVLLLAPIVALASFLIGIVGSARAADPKGAQAAAIFLVIPLFGLIALQATGVVWFSAGVVLLLAAALVLIDLLLLRLAVRLFSRETVVIRWK